MANGSLVAFLDQLATYVLARAGCWQFPTDLDRLAQHLRVSEISEREMAPEGYVEPDGLGGFRIAVRSDRSRTRKRFSIAHEIGHVILNLLEGKPTSSLTRQYRENCAVSEGRDDIEAQADYLAGMLLLPSSTMTQRLTRKIGVRQLEQIARDAEVALPVALIRSLQFVTHAATGFHLRIYDGDYSTMRCMWTHSSASAPVLRRDEFFKVIDFDFLTWCLQQDKARVVVFPVKAGGVREVEFVRSRFEDRELVYGMITHDSSGEIPF